jgi:S1-C subfamily serine protease
MRKLVLGLVAITVVLAACTARSGADTESGDRATTAAATPLDPGKEPVAAVVDRVLPAVVNVTTDVFTTDQFGNAQEGQGVGTGFIVRSDGVIVTNCHVVEGASKITVFTSDEDPTRYDARVIGGDCLHDLAVLKIDANDLPTVTLGDSASLRLGQRVVAIGYALALEGGPSVTSGIVSSLDRTIQAQDPQCEVCENGVRTYADVVQTDAAINHGNSGGPLLDMTGRVVGINSAGSDGAENIGFAIAIDAAKDTITQALNDPLGAAPYLGVSLQTVTADAAYQLGLEVDHGAYVLGVTGDGPAADVGIVQGDVIVGLDGQEVTSKEDLARIMEGLEAGQETVVTVVHGDGSQQDITLTLGTRPLPVELP